MESDKANLTDTRDERPAVLKRQGMALMQGERLEEAVAVLARACEGDPRDAEAWYLLSSVNGRLGRIEEAGECCRRAIALRPDYAEAYVNMGNVLLSQGRQEEAQGHYETALRLDPRHAGARSNLGHVQFALGKYDDAEKSFREAIDLDSGFVVAYYNLGNLCRIQRRYDEAVHNYREAIRLNPNYAAAHNNLGAALLEQDDLKGAAESFRRALALDAGYAEAYNNLALVLRKRYQLEAAEEMAERALRHKPDFADAYVNLGVIRTQQGRPEDAVRMYQEALRLEPHQVDVYDSLLMTMHYVAECTQADLSRAARQWAARYAPSRPCLPPPANDADPRRRLRIGYVSGDFRQHPVGYFIEPVLAHHDRSRCEVFCYYNGDESDDQNARLRARADRWCDIAGWPDEAAARRIREDGIDVLVDLSGHTALNRLTVFAHKPAPVQATWLGYFDTTGLEAMDYIIADRFVIPPGEEHYYVERVARLPDSFLCYSPPPFLISVSELPALATGKVTFGCFNNPAKFPRDVVECWAGILCEVPGSQLYMKFRGSDDEGVRQYYRGLFARHGIASERTCFSDYSPRGEYLSAYGKVDIALDPFPYNGGTITADTLWMGVPVISLRGDRFAGRMGESISTVVGLEDFVADTREAYIGKAVAAASDLERLAALRKGLRERLISSPLCDGVAFTRSLESLYRGMWEAWCRARPHPHG